MNDEEIWRHVRLVTEWLDKESAPAEDPRILRTFKIAEEVGEVAAAVIGATGQNPRKGVTHTWDEVQEEVCDVILAAMVALDCMTGDAQERFTAHVQKRHARVLDLSYPRCSCCGERCDTAFQELPEEWWCGNCVSRCEPGGRAE